MQHESCNKTLRLIFPQWQGGNITAYHFGAQLLSWLAPAPKGPVEQVDVPIPDEKEGPLPTETGIVARSALLRQTAHAQALIKKHQPDRIVILGGDCLVDLAPFAYLNERYAGDMGILWVDAHPDVTTPKEYSHAHAMVLGNLLGQGDQDFVNFVSVPIKPKNVMYAGLEQPSETESAFIKRLDLQQANAQDLASTSEPVLEWIRVTGIKHLAIHLDLDVLDVNQFHSLYFGRPNVAENAFDGISQGKMTMEQIIRLFADVAQAADIVGLGIAEHLPWDAINLKNMLMRLPLIGGPD